MMTKLKFKIDKNIPPLFSARLQAEGYDALTVVDQGLKGEDDDLVSNVCLEENRVMITQDLGFADIRIYPPELFPGIIVLRSKEQDRETYGAILDRIIKLIGRHPLTGKLWIIGNNSSRIRGGGNGHENDGI